MTQETPSSGEPHQKPEQPENEHQKAVEFIERNRDYFEHYARGQLSVEPAPEGLNTFAADMERGTMYIHGRFYKDQGYDLSDEKTSFAVLHELAHLEERMHMLKKPGGDEKFGRYLRRIKESGAYSLMDNCVADIRENRAVVARTHEGFAHIERDLYKQDLFQETDMTMRKDPQTGEMKPVPRHIQFVQALLRESRVPDEPCVVAPEVRAKLDELHSIKKRNVELLDAMTHPDLAMPYRLKLQDEYIWPMVKELMGMDLEDKKKEQEGSGENRPSEDSGQKGSRNRKDSKKKLGKGKKFGGRGADEKPNPDQVFADAYSETNKKMPHAVPVKEIEKAFKEWKERHGENPLERADKEYAKKIGVKVEDLRRYRDIVRSLDRIVNPETNESVIEELRNLINRIIARRLKPKHAPRYPTEEGEELVDPAELYSQVKKGNLEPRVWETIEIQERKGKKFGEVEITLICDRSGSMEEVPAKLNEQRKAAVLVMEALKEFADQCEDERIRMDKPLEVRSEIYSFQATGQDAIPLKSMSKELGEKERIDVAAMLSSAPGQSTTDFVPLEVIHAGLDEEITRKMSDGELKKIVIVFTDGESSDPGRVKTILKDLRDKGVVAIGVGITEDGRAALTTYAPETKLAVKAEDLGIVLGDLLKEHLADL